MKRERAISHGALTFIAVRENIALIGCAGAIFACAESLPTMETVAGTYAATVFTLQEGDEVLQDILAQGGFINLALTVEGTTSGRAFVPGGGEGGEDFDADLTGTWMLDSVTVTLDHSADTFLRDMSFTVEGDQLLGQESFGGATVTLELSKQ